MKVPPQGGQPAPKPPRGGRPKGLTKRTVKGAAGGMLGVDYEDARRPDAFLAGKDDSVAADDGQEIRRQLNAEGEGDADRLMAFARADNAKDHRPDRSAFSDQGKDQDAGDHTARTKQKKRVNKLRHSHESDENKDERQHEDSAEVFEDGVDEMGSGGIIADHRRSEYFQDASPGDLSLVNPDDIHRALATPVAYAKHIMILTEAFRRSTGATRPEAVHYMAGMFLGPSDRHFGWAALKEFGHATGIIDIYPLEIIEHILENHAGHLPKVSFGRLFVAQEQSIENLESDTETPLVFRYPEKLKIRGFALKGGGQPGYLFQPGEEPGLYELHIKSPGLFTVLVSALNRKGYSVIDRFKVQIHETEGFVAFKESGHEYPDRDARRIAKWPMPDLENLSPLATVEESAEAKSEKLKLMSAADLIHFKTMSAMQGPKTNTQDEEQASSSTAADELKPDQPAVIQKQPVMLKQENHSPEIFDVPTPWSEEASTTARPETARPTTAKPEIARPTTAKPAIRKPQTDKGQASEKITLPLDEPMAEDLEQLTGEATQPLDRSQLEWILADGEKGKKGKKED